MLAIIRAIVAHMVLFLLGGPLILATVGTALLQATLDAFEDWANELPFWEEFRSSFKRNVR